MEIPRTTESMWLSGEESRLKLSLWLTHCMSVGRVAQQDRRQ